MQRIATLLVVADADARRTMRAVLNTHRQLDVHVCADAREALKEMASHRPQLLYTDVDVAGTSGIALAEQAKQHVPGVHILIGSSTPTARDVVDALEAGADDFVVDTADEALVDAVFAKATDAIRQRGDARSPASSTAPTIITQDPSLQSVLDMARKIAPSTASVLITGESGTGKELLARFVHAHSQRPDAPYRAINCAALPDQLAESELFGHEKGAFTGAVTRKIGQFEHAGSGTLVLDEITEMALPLQAKLLRALQEREILRLGGQRPIAVDARVIAISNRNMAEALADGHLRDDLYYRLNVIPLTIPPLRQRKSDIPLLADHFLRRYGAQNGRGMARISDAAMTMLLQQPWPGNVRELENTIQRGVLIGSGETLLPDHLILPKAPDKPSVDASASPGRTVKDVERELIFNTLQAVNDNRTHAAKMLGISIRTLRNKLNDYRAESGIAG